MTVEIRKVVFGILERAQFLLGCQYRFRTKAENKAKSLKSGSGRLRLMTPCVLLPHVVSGAKELFEFVQSLFQISYLGVFLFHLFGLCFELLV